MMTSMVLRPSRQSYPYQARWQGITNYKGPRRPITKGPDDKIAKGPDDTLTRLSHCYLLLTGRALQWHDDEENNDGNNT